MHLPNEVGEEDEGSREDRDQVQAVREIAPNLGSHLGDAHLNLSFGEQDLELWPIEHTDQIIAGERGKWGNVHLT